MYCFSFYFVYPAFVIQVTGNCRALKISLLNKKNYSKKKHVVNVNLKEWLMGNMHPEHISYFNDIIWKELLSL